MSAGVKSVIAWPVSWGLYGVGLVFAKFALFHEKLGSLYRPYNWCMVMSYNVQEWGGDYGPWLPAEDVED